jgi:glutathione S-transferase
MIIVSAFKSVPPFARGLVRDLRVRWALEEAGLPYEQKLLADGEKDSADYREWQPFGQVPAYEEDGLRRATEWLIAALNSVEPAIQSLAAIDLFYAQEEWAKLRRPGAEEMVRNRLAAVQTALGNDHWLTDNRFSAGDLMMATVLRILRHTDLIEKAGLGDYLARCEERPAFQRALDAQMAAFAA